MIIQSREKTSSLLEISCIQIYCTISIQIRVGVTKHINMHHPTQGPSSVSEGSARVGESVGPMKNIKL